MQRLVLAKIILMLLVLLAPQQVPGAATQPLPHTATSSQCSEPVLRKLDLALRRLSQTLQQNKTTVASIEQLQQIEDLWQQLFALSQSPALNKLYNQYQVQLQVALHNHAAISPQTQARQMTALRQRLLAALTPTP